MMRPLAAVLVAAATTLAACGGTATVTDPAANATTSDPAAAIPDAEAPPSTLPLYTPPAEVASSDATQLEPLLAVSVDEPLALPVTVASADGSMVEITDASRVLPLWGNLSEIVFSLGHGDLVVGRDSSATFPEAAGLPLVTNGHDVSAESVLSLRPTLVLAQTDTGPPEALDQIRRAGVTVLVLDTPRNVDDAMTRIDTVATAIGAPGAGDALASRTAQQIAAARSRVPTGDDAPVVAFLYMRGSAGVYLLGGPGSGADSMIQAAGGIDAGTAMGLDNAFTPLTSEALVSAAPDAILMTTTGLESVGGIDGLVGIPGIAQTPAGRDRRIIAVEDGLLYSFGARAPLAIERIVDQLYPGTS